jgi:hypothetical protein
MSTMLAPSVWIGNQVQLNWVVLLVSTGLAQAPRNWRWSSGKSTVVSLSYLMDGSQLARVMGVEQPSTSDCPGGWPGLFTCHIRPVEASTNWHSIFTVFHRPEKFKMAKLDRLSIPPPQANQFPKWISQCWTSWENILAHTQIPSSPYFPQITAYCTHPHLKWPVE